MRTRRNRQERNSQIAKTKPPESLATRLSDLIDRRYDGNIASAAAAIGVQRTTLMRIAEGFTEDPRAALVAKIADHFHVHTGWLLTGREPAARETVPGNVKWDRLVKSLNLPSDVSAALQGFPATPWRASATMAREIEGSAGNIGLFGLFGYTEEADVWSRWLSGAIQTYGREKVAAWLVKRHDDVVTVRNAFAADMPKRGSR